MTNDIELPGVHGALTETGQRTSREFYAWFRRLQRALDSGSIDLNEIRALIAQLAVILGSPTGDIDDIPLPLVHRIRQGTGINVTPIEGDLRVGDVTISAEEPAPGDIPAILPIGAYFTVLDMLQSAVDQFPTPGPPGQTIRGDIGPALALMDDAASGDILPAYPPGQTPSGLSDDAHFLRGDGPSWQNALNGPLSVGHNNSPTQSLDVRGAQNLYGQSTAAPRIEVNGLHISAPDSANTALQIDTYGTGLPNIITRRALGTAASPVALTTDTVLLNQQVRGFDGTAYSLDAGSLQFFASENWTPATRGTKARLRTVIAGAAGASNRLFCSPGGNVFIGISEVTADVNLTGSGNLKTSNQLHDNNGRINREVFGSGTGTVYTMTAVSAAINFGTTDPQVTLPAAGVWALYPRCRLNANAATLGAGATNVKLRRTNNTPADVPGCFTNSLNPAFVLATQSLTIGDLPYVIYTTANTNDIIAMFGNINAAPVLGTVTCTEASILAIRLHDA